MSRRNEIRRTDLFGVLCLCALLANSFACAATPTGFLTEDPPMPAEGQRVVFVPMNFDYVPPADLLDGLARLEEGVRRELESSSLELIEPKRSRVAKMWRGASKVVGGLGSLSSGKLDVAKYEEARKILAQSLLKEHASDVAVLATMMVADGRIVGSRLRWDGHYDDIPFVKEGPGVAPSFARGKATGTSLRVSLFDKKGTRFFEKQVGVEPLHQFSYGGEDHPPMTMRIKVRPDLFGDKEKLGERVAAAFDPWLVVESSDTDQP